MTFDELDQSLPNGFHDAQLKSFAMDYVAMTLRLDLDVWIGDMNKERRTIFRPARVTLSGVGFLANEAPTTEYPWIPGYVTIDTHRIAPEECSAKWPDLPAGTEVTSIYVSDFNSSMHFSCASAALEWTGPEEDRG